jgi:hypothetical protein
MSDATSHPADVPDPGPISADARLCLALQTLGDLRAQLDDAQRSLAGSIAQLATIAGVPDPRPAPASDAA